jgi:chromosomal replication initiator protein
MPRPAQTFARFVATPENRAAWLAVRDFLNDSERAADLVYLHGPPGSGKTHLVQALVAELTHRRTALVASVLAAGDLGRVGTPGLFGDDGQAPDLRPLNEARHSDLLVIEDLQHLSLHAVETLVQVIDHLQARRRPVVITGSAGPQQLRHRGHRFPARLTNRLAGGLVVTLAPLGAASRLVLLQDLAQRRQLAVPTEVLRWLARHLAGGRQLEGAVHRLETLAKGRREPLDVPTVAAAFAEHADGGRLTVERIAERVGGYFQVRAAELQSRRRLRTVLVPRQVGMYLARQLTPLSLEQIGAYFGGRDHSTVLHACRKVEAALGRDPRLSGAVRQIRAELV